MPAADAPRLKVVYILGSSRSGSTLLDTLIGNADRTLSAGELGHLFWAFDAARAGKTSALSWCSCGRLVTDCPVWSTVWAELATRYDLKELSRQTDRFETIVRSAPTDVLAPVVLRGALRRHLEALVFTVRSLARITDVRAVVDSSKCPSRAWLYSRLPSESFDLRFLHVVRDGPTVVSSAVTHFEPSEVEGRPAPYPPLLAVATATLHWLYMNVAASMIGRLHRRRYLRVDFEDFAQRPLESLSALESFLDIDLEPVRQRIRDGQTLTPGHILCGNRSKLSSAQLRPPPARPGRDSLSAGQRFVFDALGGWLQWYYFQARPSRMSSAIRAFSGRIDAPVALGSRREEPSSRTSPTPDLPLRPGRTT